MQKYTDMTREELMQEKESLMAQYRKICEKGLSLDMSRGKPSPDQLDEGMELLDAVNSRSDLRTENGLDARNYGGLDGIPEAKRLMAGIMGVRPEQVIVCGNSSLHIMFDTVSRGMAAGFTGHEPWSMVQPGVKFLCPVPGYDRHFTITEHFSVGMINIPMTPEGPDMDMVEQLAEMDETIKGIWCVPKYSNPQGIVYSDETVRRLAAMKPAATDFRIFWDNAYAMHHLYEDDQPEILNILDECEKAGHPDRAFVFGSTSKISFAGAGIAAIASSEANLADMRKTMAIQTISYDKINQLRHVRYYKDAAGVAAHMKKHADLMRPKFELVLDILQRELAGCGAGSWLSPRGGYFITFDAMPGCATRIVQLAKEAGVVLTAAGAPFPYGRDPKDSVIRIAPSYPSLEELRQAAEVFVACAKLATVEKLLQTP